MALNDTNWDPRCTSCSKEYPIGTIIGYDPTHKLYQIEYTDGDREEMYHNEVHAHKDPIKKSNVDLPDSRQSVNVSKRKDIRQKYRTRSWKKRNNAKKITATNVFVENLKSQSSSLLTYDKASTN